MTLCDIGNTTVHLRSPQGEIKYPSQSFDPAVVGRENIYYICVHPELSLRLEPLPNWINLAPLVMLEGSYETLGIDRKLAAWHLHDGIVVDAGSAITVDMMQAGRYQGGFIHLGFNALREAYKRLSSRLDTLINFELSLDTMPKNTQDAISYAAIVPLVSHINALASGRRVVLTGGDAPKLAPYILNACLEPNFLFEAMQALIHHHKGALC